MFGIPNSGSSIFALNFAKLFMGENIPKDADFELGFLEFLSVYTIWARGTVEEKANLIFHIFDVNNHSYLVKSDIVDIMKSIFNTYLTNNTVRLQNDTEEFKAKVVLQNLSDVQLAQESSIFFESLVDDVIIKFSSDHPTSSPQRLFYDDFKKWISSQQPIMEFLAASDDIDAWVDRIHNSANANNVQKLCANHVYSRVKNAIETAPLSATEAHRASGGILPNEPPPIGPTANVRRASLASGSLRTPLPVTPSIPMQPARNRVMHGSQSRIHASPHQHQSMIFNHDASNYLSNQSLGQALHSGSDVSFINQPNIQNQIVKDHNSLVMTNQQRSIQQQNGFVGGLLTLGPSNNMFVNGGGDDQPPPTNTFNSNQQQQFDNFITDQQQNYNNISNSVIGNSYLGANNKHINSNPNIISNDSNKNNLQFLNNNITNNTFENNYGISSDNQNANNQSMYYNQNANLMRQVQRGSLERISNSSSININLQPQVHSRDHSFIEMTPTNGDTSQLLMAMNMSPAYGEVNVDNEENMNRSQV